MIAICQDCEAEVPLDDLLPVRGLYRERVLPGEPMPACECPHCGAVCQMLGDDNDQWLTRTVQFSREQWEHWRGLAERIAELATAADTYVGVGKSALSYLPLAEADEERAECETELANVFVDLLGLDENRTPLMLSDG